MKIPIEIIPDAYKFSKQVFENKLTSDEAAVKLHNTHNININSAKDYVFYFKYLITGMGSCRILSSYTQEYFLKRIYEDYGKGQLGKSLKAFRLLIVTFEGEKVGSKKSMRAVYEKYLKLV